MERVIRRKYRKELTQGVLKLLGNLPPAQWQSLTAQSSVIIIPSVGDNYPFTVLESMANGHLVLVSKQGGQSEIVEDGVNGFVFDHNVLNHLEEKILEIEDLPIDKLTIIRQNAILSVKKLHNYETVYQKKHTLIEGLLRNIYPVNKFPFTRLQAIEINPTPIQGFSTKLLSVVIPYYNMGNYIEETLSSVYESTYRPLEVIIVNDGSTDASSNQKIESLKKKYEFHLIATTNQGLAATRNQGAKAARGAFLAFLDADDMVAKDYFAKAVDLLSKKSNVSFVGSWVQYFETTKAVWPAFQPEPPYILYYNMVCSGGLVFKREAFCYGGWNDRALEYGLEDWEAVVSMIGNNLAGAVLPEPFYLYRIRKNSMARRFTEEKLLYSTSYIAQKHKELYAKFAAELSGLYNANGPAFRIDNPTIDYHKHGRLIQKYPALRQFVGLYKRYPIIKKVVLNISTILKKT